MVGTTKRESSPSSLASDHVGLSRMIAGRLHRSYHWVCLDDLQGYAFLGVALAAKAYEAERGVPFDRFASRKGMFLAIDEMRKDGVLQRRRAKRSVTTTPILGEMRDPNGDRAAHGTETRDLCAALLGKLNAADRRLLMLYYGDHLTFKEIADVFEISESAVCLRHKALIKKLRRLARGGPRA